MAKDKEYILVIDSARRSGPGTPLKDLPRTQEHVVGAKAAARRAAALVRGALIEGVDSRFVNVFDAATRKGVMICHGPALASMRSKRSASHSFARCQITQIAFKKAVKVKPKRKRR